LNQLLSALSRDQVVLDLGCGGGSFHYETCPGRIVALDSALERHSLRNDSRIHYLRGDSSSLPLSDHSIDAVVCHHTLEHFSEYKSALSEIKRVLRTQGWLWIAVPNGNALDDHLYRLVFSGGGHVNRFSHDALVQEVQQATELRLVAECSLFSGFIYLRRPTDDQLQHYPPSARPLAKIPEGFSAFGSLALNGATRIIDKVAGSRLSQYGWGFLFSNSESSMCVLPSYFNVCRKCGSGHAYRNIVGRTVLGVGLYACPGCKESNVCVLPPAALD
jgi:hypothetical protein